MYMSATNKWISYVLVVCVFYYGYNNTSMFLHVYVFKFQLAIILANSLTKKF